VNAEQARQEAAQRLKDNHRRARDNASPTQVTIRPHTAELDIVRVEYGDGEVREFERLAPESHA